MIEIDGGQHYDEPGKNADRRRDDALSRMGLKVLRFSDREVFENVEAVMETIWRHI